MNIYAIMALYHLINIVGDEFNQYAESFSEVIGDFIDKTIKDNSVTAYAIYVLFETISLILKSLSDSNGFVIIKYDEVLRPKLNKIFSENRTDIIGYCF